MAIKGSTRIELTNVHTGEKEVVEHHNMITNVLADMNKRMHGVNGMDTFLYMYAKQFLGADDPFWKAMFSGIILFEDALSDNADEYIFPAGNKVTGCGDIERVKTQDMTDKSCSVIGNFNSDESVLKDNMVKMVYDFPTSQGNGQISSIALCNKLLSRSCYRYGNNNSIFGLFSTLERPTMYSKNASCISISNSDNVYTIKFYYHATENLKIKLASKLQGGIAKEEIKTVSVDLGTSDYSFAFQDCEKNIVIFQSNTTGKYKYVCLIDGSVYEKTVPSAYDYVYPFDGYFIGIKKSDSLYYYSILKDDGTMVHENVFSHSGICEFARGMIKRRYVFAYDRAYVYLIDVTTGGVSKLYIGNFVQHEYDLMYTIFDDIISYSFLSGGSAGYQIINCLQWQPWLTTKNNLETPVTKTADKTMKVTYTLTEA